MRFFHPTFPWCSRESSMKSQGTYIHLWIENAHTTSFGSWVPSSHGWLASYVDRTSREHMVKIGVQNISKPVMYSFKCWSVWLNMLNTIQLGLMWPFICSTVFHTFMDLKWLKKTHKGVWIRGSNYEVTMKRHRIVVAPWSTLLTWMAFFVNLAMGHAMKLQFLSTDGTSMSPSASLWFQTFMGVHMEISCGYPKNGWFMRENPV